MEILNFLGGMAAMFCLCMIFFPMKDKGRAKPRYRLVEVNGYWVYEVQRRDWLGRWVKIAGTDYLSTAQTRFNREIYGPKVITEYPSNG